MGMLGLQLKNLELGARIHDIGKLDIPSDILSKPGALTPQEYDLIKTHSAMGCDIVAGEILPPVIQDIILHHHERWDGSGYPDGLVGTEISLESRIVAVADTLESITSHRPYRPGRGLRTALDIIKEEKGRLLDPDVVEVCVAMGEEGYFDWLIVQ
jgi:HD-GYP domain-containing protein (c-di-GMP phosphodiesterase class II)